MNNYRSFIQRVFNLQHAVVGAFLMGISVFFGNLPAGVAASLRAGAIQGMLSFCIVGVNMALHQYVTDRYGRLSGVLIPSLFTTTIAAVIHLLSNTPELLNTLVIVFCSALAGFMFWSEIGRRFQTIQPLRLIEKLGHHQQKNNRS